MTAPYAKVIADSTTEGGHRLTTFEVRMHRFVLAEFNTHRVFSRNSASSRAIPFPKQLVRVLDDPAIPLVWAGEQKGMQGGEPLEGQFAAAAEARWLTARDRAVESAQALAAFGVHKSIVNRLLEPFMWHTVVVTATAWENFFRQRVSPLAQPEIRAAAEMMLDAYKNSEPLVLGEGDWHLPYLEGDTQTLEWVNQNIPLDQQERAQVRISAARCARVSYLTQDGVRDPQEDINLYKRLVGADPMHASPLEHVATPAPWNVHGVPVRDRTFILPRVGNFLGWMQHRLEIEAVHDYQFFA